ncbi:hypothetical protein AVEN_95580-1 [Araneus ventricosus]|uniref:Uncharacterized protein n=1 Tax=Araneus ventricosus TaxID=182803 RepID=A0A4Y2PDK3_ARAVE|nr:hypothetical protein AVEN_95580-1 [Araneus ventricosus]
MRSCCHSACFLLLMDSQNPHVLAVRGDPLDGWCTVGNRCINSAGILTVWKKLKKDYQVNQDNITVDKVSQYYKPPQLTDEKPSEASNSVIKESNITVTKNGTKSAHVCFVGTVPDLMAAFPPEKAKVLQSLESDADAEMSSSSASEGDTLEYEMSEDLEDTPQNVCPTTPPPPSTARKR